MSGCSWMCFAHWTQNGGLIAEEYISRVSCSNLRVNTLRKINQSLLREFQPVQRELSIKLH
jgi:hypothetical protein